MKNTEKYFIDINRFNDAKANIGVSNTTIAKFLGVTTRTIQQYLSKVNQRPIPERSLNFLASYLEVTPEWLCGLSDELAISLPFDFLYSVSQCYGFPGDIHAYLVKKEISDVFGRSIKGKKLSIEKYRIYLDEVENAINYVTDRFLVNLENMKE